MAKKLRGAMAPTVPGALKGWEAVHKKCGNRPWAELWQDAIGYAENGWPLDFESNFHIKRHIAEIGINESWAKEFLVNNDAPGAGYMLKRPESRARPTRRSPPRARTRSTTVRSATSSSPF